MIVPQDADVAPFDCQHEVGPSVAVHVGEQRSGDHADSGECAVVHTVGHEGSIHPPIQVRRWGEGIPAWNDPASDEQIETPVAVIVRQRERTDTRRVPGEKLG